MAGRLPDGFQEVAYIAAEGGPYIDSAISGYTTTIEVDTIYQFTNLSQSNSALFGLGKNGSACDLYFEDRNGTLTINYDDAYYSESNNANKHTLYYKRGSYTIDGTTHTVSVGTPNLANGNVFIFRFNNIDDTAGSDRRYGYAKIFDHFTMKRDGVAVRNFIPCYCTTSVTAYQGSTATTASSGTIGLYDLVNSRFYINSGSGTFSKGSDILPVSYTKIGGTSYQIVGGKTLIGGTSYSITGGKTLIGGTSKTIYIPYTPAGLWLYNQGDTCSSVTGGYSGTFKYVDSTTYFYNSGTVTFNSNNFCVNSPSARCASATRMMNSINLTYYSTLHVNVTSTGRSGSCATLIAVAPNLTYGSASVSKWNFSTGEITLDISSLTGSYYIIFASNVSDSSSGYANMYIDKIWLT